MERERHHPRPSSDDYVTHVRSLVPVRGSDPWVFASVVGWGIYEYIAGFVALIVAGFLFAGVREYQRPLPPIEAGHVGLGPLFREFLVPHKERIF